MHIQIVTFQLKELSEDEFLHQGQELAPAFAALPGLVSKVWLADASTNTYGGVYTWRDRQAMDAYLQSALFHAVATNPHFAGVTSRDFAVLEAPTRITRGALEVTV